MTIGALPTPPGPTDDVATFNARAFALLGALPAFVTETNATAAEVDADRVASQAAQTAAELAEANAEAAQVAAQANADAAASSAGAAVWVSGTTYALHDVVFSPATRMVYRRIVAGAGTTDPSADATNWSLATNIGPQLVISASTSNNARAGQQILLGAAGLSTVTLPASPQDGDFVWVTVGNARLDNVIDRNGQLLQGLAENLTIDDPTATVQLRFINTLGWRIIQ